nr:hypothetical protein [Deltaproteobacteria bacterium]
MADPFDSLRRDVTYLGHVLGDTLVEQGGAGLLAVEEEVRALARPGAPPGAARRPGRCARCSGSSGWARRRAWRAPSPTTSSW